MTRTSTKRRRQKRPEPETLFAGYQPLAATFDEFFDPKGAPRPEAARVIRLLEELGRPEFRERQQLANATFLQSGITFSVYSDQRGAERIFPFDLIPAADPLGRLDPDASRPASSSGSARWTLFLADVYGPQKILAEGVDPAATWCSGPRATWPEMHAASCPPGGVYVHIAGIDLIRDVRTARFLVLEDNARTPSGVSYVLENRLVMKKVFPRVFARRTGRAASTSTPTAAARARSTPWRQRTDEDEDSTVVLTPGPLQLGLLRAQLPGAPHGRAPGARGSDLFVDDDRVLGEDHARTAARRRHLPPGGRRLPGPRRRSIRTACWAFRAWCGRTPRATSRSPTRSATAWPTDKGIYPYVPEMIRFYLSEEPILGQVRTYICERQDD